VANIFLWITELLACIVEKHWVIQEQRGGHVRGGNAKARQAGGARAEACKPARVGGGGGGGVWRGMEHF